LPFARETYRSAEKAGWTLKAKIAAAIRTSFFIRHLFLVKVF
jgi:hypothetical protein